MNDKAFWCGASLALVPALAGAVGVSYSGMAAVNAIWRLTFTHDSPGLFMVVGGMAYGLTVGVLVPLFLFGTAARLIWPSAARRLASHPSAVKKSAVGVVLQLLTLPISVCLTFAAYGLPWIFLWPFVGVE